MSAARYVQLYRSEHPVATSYGFASEHRVVLYDTIGSGAHRCHWCDREIEWFASGARRLVTDHLDGNGRNNDPENLVPSCTRCNAWRSRWPDTFSIARKKVAS